MDELEQPAADCDNGKFVKVPDQCLSYARDRNICPVIHVDDFIYRFVQKRWKDVDRGVYNYYNQGIWAAQKTLDLVSDVVKAKEWMKRDWKPKRILDFASGYGCMARSLPSRFPDWDVVTCDIHDEAVAFNSSVLGLESHVSATVPEELAVGGFDVVVAVSFFTHMPERTYTRWLNALCNSINPGGVLIFTANGYTTHKLGRLRFEPDARGFGFKPESEQQDLDTADYGMAVSYPNWVFSALGGIPSMRLQRFYDGLWLNVQDTYVYCKDA